METRPGHSLWAKASRGAVGNLLERVCGAGSSCSGGKKAPPRRYRLPQREEEANLLAGTLLGVTWAEALAPHL